MTNSIFPGARSAPYTNVDPASYQGSWQGTYSNNQKFQFTISQVSGFRAQVKYQSGSTVQYQSVLIKDNSFRIGDSKFTLGSAGAARIRTAITDPRNRQHQPDHRQCGPG